VSDFSRAVIAALGLWIAIRGGRGFIVDEPTTLLISAIVLELVDAAMIRPVAAIVPGLDLLRRH